MQERHSKKAKTRLKKREKDKKKDKTAQKHTKIRKFCIIFEKGTVIHVTIT